MKRKKVVALLMSLAVTATSASSAFAMSADKYSDVNKDNAAFEYVADVVDKGIMTGESDDTFGLEEAVTRADLVEYMYKMMKEPTANGSLKYSDAVDTDYENALIWADSNKLFDTTADGFFKDSKFDGDTTVTREQAAQILMSMAKDVLKIDVTEGVAKDLDKYSDVANVTYEYEDAMKWAVGNELIGTEEDKLDSQGDFTKEDAAEFISKLLKMVRDDSVETVSKEDAKKVTKKSSNKKSAGATATKNTATTKKTTSKKSANKPAATHEHNWFDKAVAEVGHFVDQVTKDAWTEIIKHDEVGHYEDVITVPEKFHMEERVDVAETGHIETINHPEEGHTENRLVSPAEGYWSVVKHPAEGHFENVLVSPEEGHTETVIVKPEVGHYENVNHPEEFHMETVHHDAVTKTVDHPEEFHMTTVHHPEESHMETVHHDAVTHTIHHEAEGYYKTVHHDAVTHTEIHYICNKCGADMGTTNASVNAHVEYHANLGEAIGYGQREVTVTDKAAYDEQVWVETKAAWDETIVDKEAWDEQVKVVDKEAWDEQVKVVDKEAWTETIVIKEAWDEQVKVVDKEAWVEENVYIVDEPAVTKEVWVVDKEAVYEQKWHIDKEAWQENVWNETKPAVREDVWVVDKEAWVENFWVTDTPGKSTMLKVIDQEAVWGTKWVVDKAAYEDKIEHAAETKKVWVVDKQAHTIKICKGCGKVQGA